jgi:O-acetylserine/cysteine efflux transporter
MLPIKDALLALFVVFVWAANYAVSAIGLLHVPPLLYTAVRFSISAVVLLPFLPKLSRAQFLRIVALALVLVVVHMSGLLIAIKMGLNITTTALVAQLGVPFSCMLGVFVLGERIGRWRLLGLMLAFLGMVVVMDSPHMSELQAPFFVALAAAFAWAVSNLQLKGLSELPMIHTVGWLSVIAVPLLFLLSHLFEGAALPTLSAAPQSAWLALLYSALGSTILGYGYWTKLIKRHAVNHVAPFVLLVPVFSGVLGILFMGDAVTHELILGGALTLAGIALIVFRRPSTIA